MAGDWIKMRGNLWDDPRVARLCDLTDQSEAAIVGGLYWLWAAADQHTENGVMPGLTLRQIDRKTGVQGLGAALCQIGWLEDDAEGVRIINFEEHNGSSAKRRASEAQRKANARTTSAVDADIRRTDAEENGTECVAREEKRREEIKEEANASLSGPVGLTCPHQEILKLYAKRLPQCGQHRTWDGARQDQLRSRWHEAAAKSTFSEGYATTSDGLSWWDDFFRYIGETRLAQGFEGKDRSWRPDLEWITKKANFQKIIDGKYDK